MLDFNDNPTLSLFSQVCKVATGEFEPYLPKDKALSIVHSCHNPLRKNMPTCQDKDIDLFIKEVGGLDLDFNIPGINIPLPAYFPILDKGTSKYPFFSIPNGIDLVGLSLLDTLSKGVVFRNGSWHEQEKIEFLMNLLLGDAIRGKKVMLFMHGPDTLIEWLWYKRNDINLFKHLYAMGFTLASGMNFSVISGECPLGQCINQNKSLMSTYLANNAGIPSIPHIYTLDIFDIEKWSKYLIKNPQIQIASMNCQLQDSKKDQDVIIKNIKEFLNLFPYLHFVLVGFPLNRISEFGCLLDRIHFADKKPTKYAINYKEIIINPESLKISYRYSSKSKEELLYHNINQHRIYTEIMRKKFVKTYQIPRETMQLIIKTPLIYNLFES